MPTMKPGARKRAESIMAAIPASAALALLLAATLLFPAACARRDFANDPVKWSFVGGDGSWDSKSRRWTVYVGTGETKTATLDLQNTGSQDIVVLVQAAAEDILGVGLQSSSIVLGGNGIGVWAGKTAQLTLTATARTNIGSPRKFVVDYGWSTNEPRNPVQVVSVLDTYRSGETVIPAGPTIEITLKNVSREAVDSLNVVLEEPGRGSFPFDFPTSLTSPLAPGRTISARRTLIGGGWGGGIPYSVSVNGTLQRGSPFAFTWQPPDTAGTGPP